MTRTPLLLLLTACATNAPLSPVRGEHVYQLEYVLAAEGSTDTTRSAVTVDDPGAKDRTMFTHVRDLEIRTVFHTEGNTVYLEVAFEGGEKKERLHDREPIVIDFDREGVPYQLSVTPKRMR